MKRLLTTSQHKINKAVEFGYLGAILHLAPAETGEVGNVCPWASSGCKEVCLNTAGRGKMGIVQAARVRKTEQYFHQRNTFILQLEKEIEAHRQRAKRLKLKPCVRLNGTSDLPFHKHIYMPGFKGVRFYDYTKGEGKMGAWLRGEFHRNYELVFSRSEENERGCLRVLEKGGRVAVVFPHDSPLPKKWNGSRVVDGDKHDLFWLYPKGVVLGLKAKGRAKGDRSGFVWRGD